VVIVAVIMVKEMHHLVMAMVVFMGVTGEDMVVDTEDIVVDMVEDMEEDMVEDMVERTGVDRAKQLCVLRTIRTLYNCMVWNLPVTTQN